MELMGVEPELHAEFYQTGHPWVVPELDVSSGTLPAYLHKETAGAQ